MSRRSLLPIFLLLFVAAAGGWQLVQAQPSGAPVRVGVNEYPPFAIRYDEGWDGIAIELWEDVARSLGLQYELVEVEPENALNLLEVGQLDLVLIASPTALAEGSLDFSHSYYTTYLGFVQTQERTLGEIARALFTRRFLRITLSLSVLLLIVGALIWVAERQKNEEFGGQPRTGIWSGFWWAAVTMTTIGYGDKTPVTTAGRVLALFWMLVAIGITAALTATVTSVLTLRASTTVQFPEDLPELRVGALDGSGGAAYLVEEGVDFQRFETGAEGVRAVRQEELDLFIYDTSSLSYLNKQLLGGELNVASTRRQPRHLAFALQEGTPLLEPVNRALLLQINGEAWTSLLDRWLPESP